MRALASLIVLFSVLINTGCQGYLVKTGAPGEAISAPTPLPETTAQPRAPVLGSVTPDRSEPRLTRLPERVAPSEVITPVTGEVPGPVLDAIMADLAARVGVALGEIQVLQAQAMVWSDGSLGCPQPGVFYTQALVDGYWVVLEVNGQRYDYRAEDSEYFFLCEDGF